MIRRFVLWATYRIWQREINRVIHGMYERGIIDSRVLHEICARFDRTQTKHYLGACDRMLARTKEIEG